MRRPWSGAASSKIVPVSAIATQQAVTTAALSSSSTAVRAAGASMRSIETQKIDRSRR
jgi:hypothetical protein